MENIFLPGLGEYFFYLMVVLLFIWLIYLCYIYIIILFFFLSNRHYGNVIISPLNQTQDSDKIKKAMIPGK